ncbi:MAG: hypothetical protein ACPG40_05325, partial [Alphaproteobacteria bacterium]
MKNILKMSLSLTAFALASSAAANPAAQISKLETKLDRLINYFDANCDEDALTPKCKRVEDSILRLDEEIQHAKEAVSVSLRTTASVSVKGGTPSMIDRQFEILQVRMKKIENFMQRLEASNDPQKDAKLKALQTQLDLVQSRMLQLQAN